MYTGKTLFASLAYQALYAEKERRLNLRGNIPSFIPASNGKLHHVNLLEITIPEPAAIDIMHRTRLDFPRLIAESAGRLPF